MAKQVLNLDEVPASSTDKVIKMGGIDHEMVVPSVGDFIDSVKKAKALEKSDDPTEQFEVALEIVGAAFPTIEKEALRKLSLEKLMAIVDFVNDAGTPDVDEGAEGEEGNA